ncbi:MAG: hypothetical protein ACOX8Q_05610 [Christensenellales bacterium]|jgi:exopolyphosphatase/guanosine-5'-triphosphate,3'-diphosphate pyrophosphatase
MRYYAVVDLGTNSARLMIAYVASDAVVSVYKTLRMIRIGEEMVGKRHISAVAMVRTKRTLHEFMEIARQYGAEGCFYCFATSAVREAENKQEFIDYIRRECGILVEILSGVTEAIFGFAGSVETQGGMFDIGGGSTEVIFGKLSDIRFRHSYKIGTVRFLQMFPAADDADPETFKKAHELARNTFAAIPNTGDCIFTGIGGTATALAAIDLGLKEYLAERVQGHEISIQRAKELCIMLEGKTKKQRTKMIGLDEKRADVIVFGAIILLEFMKAVDAEKIKVSDSDSQEGYLAHKLGIIQIAPCQNIPDILPPSVC